MTNEAQVNHLDQALSKIESLITLLSSNTHGRNAESRSGLAAHAAIPFASVQPSSSGPMTGEQLEPGMHSSQQQQKQHKKDKKSPKESSVAAVPATSGDGLFYRAQLQVVKVLTVEDTESTKLLRTTIDIGNSQTRQVVAGLKGHILAEQLQGSMRVAILNLKPAKLAGMASEAMLLAADAPQESGAELVRLLIPPDGSDAGDKVFLEGGEAPAEYAKTLKSEPWKIIVENLSVQGGKAIYEEKALVTAKGAIMLPQEMPDGAGIH